MQIPWSPTYSHIRNGGCVSVNEGNRKIKHKTLKGFYVL